jgi:hypothetical protein
MFDYTHQYQMQLLVNDRTLADEYAHTDGTTSVEARPGSEYSLMFRNNSLERIAVVPAIDGLSVIDGQPAGIDSPSYIVGAGGTLTIPGWSKSDKEVARFVFWDKNNSYAAQTGNGTHNTGVIGALVFRETPPSFLTTPMFASAGDYSIRSLNSTASTQDAGTGHGRLEQYSTTSVTFNKRDPKHPDAQIVLYYDTGKSLERKGITLRYKQNYAPDPFPTAPSYLKNTR